MSRTRSISRRRLLLWMLGAAPVVAAACWVPMRLVSRTVRHLAQSRGGQPTAPVDIPTRPFDERELYRPHDLAG